MGETAVITGLGAISALGGDAASFWSALLRGADGAAPVRSFDASGYSRAIACELKGEVPGARRLERPGRSALLALAAAREAMAQAGLTPAEVAEAALSLGTTMGESCWLEAWRPADVCTGPSAVPAEELLRSGPDQVGEDVATELGLGGGVTVLAAACAAGNYALGHAADLIRLGRVERVVAGATDALSRVAFTGFARLGALAKTACRPFSRDRDGLVLGEGAAMFVVEARTTARARGAKILAEVAGYGLSCDAQHIVRPDPRGRGAVRAMEAALADAGVAPDDVDYVSAHGTGTQANDCSEVAAVRAVFPGRRPPMSSIKALTGHALGAASALEAVSCVLALQEGLAPPTWNFREADPECAWDVIPNEPRPLDLAVVLNNAYAFGGCNASLVLRRPR